jgi:hypothetical protein
MKEMKKTLLTVGIVALFIATAAIPASAVSRTYCGVVKEVEINEEETQLTFTPIFVIVAHMPHAGPFLLFLCFSDILTKKSGPQTFCLGDLEIDRLSDHFIWITYW